MELDGGEACQHCECSRTSACCSSDKHTGTHTEEQLLDTFGCFVFKDRVSFAHQTDLELKVISLPQLPKYYGYRYEPPNPASFFF